MRNVIKIRVGRINETNVSSEKQVREGEGTYCCGLVSFRVDWEVGCERLKVLWRFSRLGLSFQEYFWPFSEDRCQVRSTSPCRPFCAT